MTVVQLINHMEIKPANQFTFEQLTDAYNQTRVDYLIPMPMNVARLREYTHVYDINLAASTVVIEKTRKLGLGMLGIRGNRSWITRLGVLPDGRKRGIGHAIMEDLIAHSYRHQIQEVWLEVIKGNAPAHRLFNRFGFQETRDLIIARRPPQPEKRDGLPQNIRHVTYLQHDEAIRLLGKRKKRPNWLIDTATMGNLTGLSVLATSNRASLIQTAKNISGLQVELDDGSMGWVTYQATFLQLTRIVVEVVRGDATAVTSAILQALHHHHTQQDAIVENIPDDDQWLGFKQAGYFEAFRRIEMVKKL